MPLTIYRRHLKRCSFYEKSRKARNNSQCKQRCPIWVQGTLKGEKVWRSLDMNDWGAAADLIRSWEASGEIGVVKPEIPTIPASVEKFMASIGSQNLSEETIRKYRYLLEDRFLEWCRTKKYKFLRQLGTDEIDTFRQTWDDGPNYATKNLERLRAFFRFCLARKWIELNPAEAVKSPKVPKSQKLPFSDEEIARIIAACDRYRGNRKRIKTFILTMRYSGLRIGDTIALKKSRLTENRLFLRASKNEADVFVPLPHDVANGLRELENPTEYFFKNGKGKSTTDRANWSRYLDTIFELAEVPDGHSHRFRHTFACGLFSQGASIKQVATLLGDSPEVVAKHYSAHVKKHQDDIEALVSQTWAPQNPATPEGAAAANS